MSFEKRLVSPRGREVVAKSPAEANDLLNAGYREPAPEPVSVPEFPAESPVDVPDFRVDPSVFAPPRRRKR